MAWTYAAFEEEATNTARLTMLRQHISEVRAQISADVSGAEFSRSSSSLNNYLAGLERRRDELERKVARESGGLVGRLGHARDGT